jgi:hypothetical protein
MRNLLLVIIALGALSACSNQETCLPAAAPPAACPANVYIDASTTDPICLAKTGAPLCRGGDNCYVCVGASFDDGCVINSAEQTLECVHGCDKC